MEPTLDSLLDAPAEHAGRIRAALLIALPGDPAATLQTALERLSAWHHEVEAVGERIDRIILELDTAAEQIVRASSIALREDGASGVDDSAILSQAMELAWLAGGSAGDVPAITGERLRQSLMDAHRSLDTAADVVKRFRHGAEHARVLGRPAVIEPAVRDAAKLLLATRRAARVRKVLSEAARRSWIRPVAEGSQRELLLTTFALMETGEVTDRELAERFARQGLLRERQVARSAVGSTGFVTPESNSVAAPVSTDGKVGHADGPGAQSNTAKPGGAQSSKAGAPAYR